MSEDSPIQLPSGKELGSYIENTRERVSGLTQQDLAKTCGVSRAALDKLVREGKESGIGYSKLKRLVDEVNKHRRLETLANLLESKENKKVVSVTKEDTIENAKAKMTPGCFSQLPVLDKAQCLEVSSAHGPTVAAKSLTSITVYFAGDAVSQVSRGDTCNYTITFSNAPAITGRTIVQ